MGEIVVNVGLENPVDRINANRGISSLDLIPDPTNRTLAPRMPDYPLLNLK